MKLSRRANIPPQHPPARKVVHQRADLEKYAQTYMLTCVISRDIKLVGAIDDGRIVAYLLPWHI